MVKSKLFITKTAIELLFDGYDDPLLTLGQKLPSGMFPPFDKFAWFYQRNNSDYYDGVFNIFTGVDQITKFGEMDTWNLTRQTKYLISNQMYSVASDLLKLKSYFIAVTTNRIAEWLTVRSVRDSHHEETGPTFRSICPTFAGR